MTTKAALFALLALWGVGTSLPARAEDIAPDDPTNASYAGASPCDVSFTNRAWTKSEPGELPGVTRIFLSDGTLVQDSCWDTHRLSQWKMVADRKLIWNENGIDITADIVTLGPNELVLSLNLPGGSVRERYTSV
ncbi:MAG: hypothetical protein JWN11_1260 [Hyphomicrobiales bacterium]|nr:hypothetical protein [Hyphomicrobiales bacterium]